MRCVVTGAAGFIGSHLSEELLGRGHTVVGVDAFVPYYPAEVRARNQASLLAHPQYHFHAIDLRTDPLEPAVAGADVVFHLAARPGPAGGWDEFEAYWTCNAQGTHRLLTAVRAAAPYVRRVVLASSSAVYGTVAVGAESTPTLPVTPYGVSKLTAEHVGRAFGESFGLPVVTLRYFGVYGPRQRPDQTVHESLAALIAGGPVDVSGDGHQVRSPAYVSDAVAAAVAAVDAPAGEVYNVGGGEPVSALDLVRKLEHLTGRPADVHFLPARDGDRRHVLADTTKLRNHLGWAPKVGLDDGLARQWQWQWQAAEAETAPLIGRAPVRYAAARPARTYT
jgi:nucleoside-diphosphate-sugar epimerase